MNKYNYVNATEFHNSSSPVYKPNDESKYFKKSSNMARVLYTNSHENPEFKENDPKHGLGKNFCKWISSEQPGKAEGFSFNGNLNGILESRLEPGASVGWHYHSDTEEYYYVLSGSLYIECKDEEGNTYSDTLYSGDFHRISKNMSHYALAGSEGALFLAIIVKAV